MSPVRPFVGGHVLNPLALWSFLPLGPWCCLVTSLRVLYERGGYHKYTWDALSVGLRRNAGLVWFPDSIFQCSHYYYKTKQMAQYSILSALYRRKKNYRKKNESGQCYVYVIVFLISAPLTPTMLGCIHLNAFFPQKQNNMAFNDNYFLSISVMSWIQNTICVFVSWTPCWQSTHCCHMICPLSPVDSWELVFSLPHSLTRVSTLLTHWASHTETRILYRKVISVSEFMPEISISEFMPEISVSEFMPEISVSEFMPEVSVSEFMPPL